MKIKFLEIENFRAIKKLTLENLNNLVLIIGQNGVGKSCVFDAIRLLKSSYGGYQPNEINNWFNEFQLKVRNNFYQIDKILRDSSIPLKVKAEFELSEKEIGYIKENSRNLVSRVYWALKHNKSEPEGIEDDSFIFHPTDSNSRSEMEKEIQKNLKELDICLNKKYQTAALEIYKDGNEYFEDNVLLQILFHTYKPDELGIIDYHGANRSYQKENIRNLNVNFDDFKDQYKGHALYNYSNKYNNVKNEMATSFVKALIARESGQSRQAVSTLNDSFNELFEIFFPGKKFNGIIPTQEGNLEFPVELSSGETHDITELSSGEKEVLFGYLRLRNHSPKNSIILIDEPELHLNPKLAKKLPEFYHKTIGQELDNQIWLVTHSDAILKECINLKGYSVYHMSHAKKEILNQGRLISKGTDIEAALIDLVGDVSEYQYGNKVVIFEGENSEFDKKMTNDLFPEFEFSINSVSAGSKSNVGTVQNILQNAKADGLINKDFISIVDKDSENFILDLDKKEFSWDAYHIENYLLNEYFILAVLQDLGLASPATASEKKIKNELISCAEEALNFHIRHSMNEMIRKELLDCIKTPVKESNKLSEEFAKSIRISVDEIQNKQISKLDSKNLRKFELKLRNGLKQSLKTDEWRKKFNGRIILNRFAGKHLKGIRYEQFRNLIVAKMKSEKFQPEGMKSTIDKILEL